MRIKTLHRRSVSRGFTSVGPMNTNLWSFNALNMYDPTLKAEVFYVTSFNEADGDQFFVTEGKPARTRPVDRVGLSS